MRCVVARFICVAVSRFVSLRDFLRSVSRSVLLRDFSAERFHTLCHCKIFLRSGLTCCVVTKFFSRSSLTHYVVARLFCGAISRVVLLRDFSCGAISRVVPLRDLFAEWFHALCRCETFLRSNLTLCVVAKLLFV